jgi:RNA polymerase sigma factor (sigma-70 family)
MASGQQVILRHIRDLMGPDRDGNLTDGELLQRFVAERDEAVFEILVQRHAGLVYSVCRRVLQNEADIEDVFQATLLVFARKAASIRKYGSLASWLYGVAFRLALKVKAGAARRRAHEREAMVMNQGKPAAECTWDDLRPVLDEELGQLPEKFRAPLILCYLEGKSHVEAAELLGWPIGSMSKRLARGRDLLRRRLVRRGLTFSGVTLGTLLLDNARAAVPAGLLQCGTRAAFLAATGQAISGIVSTHVANLAEGMVHTMFMSKLKIGLGVTLGVMAMALAAGMAYQESANLPNDSPSGSRHTAAAASIAATPELAFVPEDTVAFLRIHLQELLSAEGMGDLRREMPSRLQGLFGKPDLLSVPLGDIRTFTLVFVQGDGTRMPEPLEIVTTTKPYTQAKVRQAFAPTGQEQTANGKSYMTGENGGAALHFVDDQTFLMGRPSAVRASLTNEKAPSERHIASALQLASRKHAVVAGFRMTRTLREEIKHDPLPPVMQFMTPLLETEGGVGSIDVGAKLEPVFELSFADAAKADEAATAFKAGVNLAKKLLASDATAEARKEAFMATILDQAAMALKNVHVAQQKSTLEITSEVVAGPAMEAALGSLRKMGVASAQMRNSNNLKQIALAFMNYSSTYNGTLPAAAICDEDGKPLLSWRVAILPYLGEEALYREFKLNEPWDSEHNKQLLARRMPVPYRPQRRDVAANSTFYQVFVGEQAAFSLHKGHSFPKDFPDGVSNTVFVVEAGEAVPWTKPVDLKYDAGKPLPRLGGEGQETFGVAFCDGSVRLWPRNTDERQFRALITRNGGEAVRLP